MKNSILKMVTQGKLKDGKSDTNVDAEYAPYTLLNFKKIKQQAHALANRIENRLEDLIEILLKYESYEVAQDEISRTLDLLKNLHENKEYFRLRVGSIAIFLPRNQPLYAFACFVAVPSLMASEVHFRIPQSMRGFFPEMLRFLDIHKSFPNIYVSKKTRLQFLINQSALQMNPETKENKPVTDAVIFTGTPQHAAQLRLVFDKRTLFIANGAGHNPVVVSKNADLSKAVEAVVTLQFYNQGQDCAAPNAILVQKDIRSNLLRMLREKIRDTKVGLYKDRSCRIGPISDPKDLGRIQDILIKNREWLDYSTSGIIRIKESIVEPTIISKPLVQGGNFSEIFAPIIFIQEYKNDQDLKKYFEDKAYAQNAMYVTLYGTSACVSNLINRPIGGRVLHKPKSLLHNTHLHAPGVERGTQEYGGYGYGASSITINGKMIPMPTLPQREIYKYLVKPLLTETGQVKTAGTQPHQRFKKLQKKNVEKLLRLYHSRREELQIPKPNGIAYLDIGSIKIDGLRYIKIREDHTYYLLRELNAEYIASLEPENISLIYSLKKLLKRKSAISFDEFCALLYAIPKKPDESKTRDAFRQLHFFQHVYQLLFGKKFGPRLAPFLWNADNKEIDNLLDI